MPVADSPAVSVIVCTHNRPHMLARALESVLRQDFRDYEVVVVDDGSEPPAEVPARGAGPVRLIVARYGGVGAARAAGLKAARGPFIAYCDDDDEWAPNHLASLMHYLREHPDVDLVYGDSEWVEEEGPPSVPYSVDYDGTLLREAPYIFASDVLHRAEAARDVGGFDPCLRAYEDWDLWLRMSRVHVLRHLPGVVGRHHWHEGCVMAAKPWDEWERVHWNTCSWLTSAHRHDLVLDGARPGTPFDRSTWGAGRRELIWHAVMRRGEGYGTVGRRLLLAVERQGVDVTIAPTRNQPPPGFERFYRPLGHWGRLGFYCDNCLQPSALPCERIVNYSMWESTLVPPEHVGEINRVAALQYVPCRQNLESFRASGVRVSIKVLHLAVDPDRFPYLERCHPDSFTFGSFGDFSVRKGIDVLIRAFEDEFQLGEPVRLLLKARDAPPDYAIRGSRVTLVSGYVDQQGLLEFLRQMDVFVLPSRGEGFGLCGLEAMATGLPVIATNWSGPVEYLDRNDSFPLDYRLVDAQNSGLNHPRYFGQWAEPDYEHLRYLLRWLYEHPGKAAEMGRLAAARVRENWSWERIARQFVHDLDEVARQ
jgi:glycosyltransferase involved in cell wall biosynthesis